MKNFDDTIAYMNSEEIVSSFRSCDVYIYGTGMDGELFLNDLGSDVRIKGVFDTYKSGQEWHGYTIMGKESCLNNGVCGSLIITCFDYRAEIIGDLELLGLQAGKDFYIWDRQSSYKIDSSISRLIEWNTKTWKYDKAKKNARALIPIHYSLHDGGAIMYSYITDYVRRKYDAYVEAYIIHWKSEVSQTVADVYKSFGVTDYLTAELTAEQEIEANTIFENVWNGIHSFTDWKNISIYGIHLGSVIIRTYLRLYVPHFDPRDPELKDYLYECIKNVVFWHDRFEHYDYKVVLTWDGGAFDAIIANIAIAKGIPTYSMYFAAGRRLISDDPWCGKQYIHYKKFWEELSEEEQKYGMNWAKKKLNLRLAGHGSQSFNMKESYDAFRVGKSESRITGDEETKIVIVPHSFEDDSYMYGEHLFDDNYFSWLCHLGELSNQYKDYGWYMKIHPMSSNRDRYIINQILEKYQRIKLLPDRVSVLQMKEEGINWALTVQGSIGHEYPLLGIQVINAGANPHVAFDINWNPGSIQEYDELIANINDLKPKTNIDDVYKYYCIDQLFYDYNMRFGEEFFENQDLNADDQRLALSDIVRRNGTWKYKMFLDEFSNEEHERLKKKIENYFTLFDSWREDIFYKKAVLCEVSITDA